MAKTGKILDIRAEGIHLVCIKSFDCKQSNPYRIYRVFNGHRKLFIKYADFMSVLYFMTEFFRDGLDSMTLPEQIETIKNRTI